MIEEIKLSGKYVVECYRPSDKKIVWKDEFKNLVVTAGLTELFTNGLMSSTWYLGLTGTSPSPAAGNTMASHSGWTEFEGYDEVTREEWVEVQSGASATNAASKAEFTITSATQTIGGCFLCDNSTKGGSDGTLYSCAAFSGGDRTGNQAGDIIRVTYVASVADDGA